mmetsp:Transcript_3141/g.6027  ORF Transcript_3141/g.6027 Transcript_3141/m.6027 type:complete len:140 (-) Transcript_3141:99-518(-)
MKPLDRSVCLDASSLTPVDLCLVSLIDDKSSVLVFDSERQSDPSIGVIEVDDLKDSLKKSPRGSVASLFRACGRGDIAHIFPDTPLRHLVDLFEDNDKLRLLIVHEVLLRPKHDPIYKEIGFVTRELLRDWVITNLARS